MLMSSIFTRAKSVIYGKYSGMATTMRRNIMVMTLIIKNNIKNNNNDIII